MSPRTGGQLLVDQLLVHGAELAFCVPGESYLALLDALHDVQDRIRLVNARHEAGAANMAEAYGKLTGEPGVCLVTRGPGACHASIGVHTAFQDSTPMLLVVGQVGRRFLDREALQEIDYRRMFAPLAKWVAQIDSASRVPEYVARAYQVATSGRPGPVVLAVPEDVLAETADAPDAARYARAQAEPSPRQLAEVRAALASAERPLLLVGGSGWTDAACRDVVAFAEANDLPAACSFRRQDVFDNGSRCFAGDLGTSGPPALIERVKEADLLLVVGARLGEMTTQGYSVLDAPKPRQRLVHVHPGADELGRVFHADIPVVASPASFAAAAAALAPVEARHWSGWRESARKDFLAAIEPPEYRGELDVARALTACRGMVPADAIVTLDAGNHTGWPQRFLTYARPGRLLGPTSGAMGYSVPAAVAASLVHPGRLVLSFVGDGGFMMTGQELATAAQHGAKPIAVVFNNRMYGTIRMHQERHYPARVSGTDLVNPDFVGMGRAMGAHAELVTRTEDVSPALERAIAARKPALLELRTDPELVSTRATLTSIREKALARASRRS
jgi:acetolactate synthase-1/2/3 large subunit